MVRRGQTRRSPTQRAKSERELAEGVVWNLTDLYQEPEAKEVAEDIATARLAARRFAERYRGRVADGSLRGNSLREALQEMERIFIQAQRPGFYASLLFAAQTQDGQALDLNQRAREAFTYIKNELIFFDLELINLGKEGFRNLVRHPALSAYRHYLEHLRSFSPHTLAEREEQIINKKDLAGPSAFRELYEQLAGSLRFPVEVDGTVRELTEEELLALLGRPDPQLRRRALVKRFETYGQKSLVFSAIFNAVLLNHRIEGEIRRYPDPMSAAHLENEVDALTVQVMMDTVQEHYPLLHEYLRLKAKMLGLPKLANCDLEAPLPGIKRDLIEYPTARQLVLDAFDGFCPTFVELATQFFRHGWIDAEVRSGKSPGAFCAAFDPAHHPYILATYTGTPGDVSTIAHELGHGIHYMLARKQSYFNYDAPLVLAETASVFAELLVAYHLLATAPDSATRRQILCDLLDEIYGTVFRQTALTRFEIAAHKRCRQGRLGDQLLSNLWLTEQERLFGDTVDFVSSSELGWSCVPHFVWHCFYCYSYPFGQLLVLALFQRYQEEGEPFVGRYLGLLEQGGSKGPKELMDALGFDIGKASFWKSGFRLIADLIDQLRKD